MLTGLDRMDVLTISSAQGGAQVALVRGSVVIACETEAASVGLAATLPAMVARLLNMQPAPGLVAAVTGPGSFTGLRAGLAVAAGVAASLGVELVGVSVAEALGRAMRTGLEGRTLWVAIAGRSGHVFLDRDGSLASFALDALPESTGRVAVAGDAANPVAACLAARGCDVMLTACRVPAPADVAASGLSRMSGELAPCPALPLYVEPALARLPAGGRLPPAPLPARFLPAEFLPAEFLP